MDNIKKATLPPYWPILLGCLLCILGFAPISDSVFVNAGLTPALNAPAVLPVVNPNENPISLPSSLNKPALPMAQGIKMTYPAISHVKSSPSFNDGLNKNIFLTGSHKKTLKTLHAARPQTASAAAVSFNDNLSRNILSTITQWGAQAAAMATGYQYPAPKPYIAPRPDPADVRLAQEFAQTLIKTSDPATGLPPSHPGHPGYKHLAFVYDLSISAMMLKMTGHQAEAEHILDYFARRLTFPPEKIKRQMDANNVMGILKVMTPDARVVGLVNAVDTQSPQKIGRGKLEFFTTPGPVSFMIMAFLQVNKDKYLPQAIQLGKAALLMQHADGGIYDGDRSPTKVHTEPHMDTANAFLQLYQITGDPTWKTACDKAITWFKRNVYKPQTAQIYQGLWEGTPHTIFATDVYSWTMDGIMGDLLSTHELEALTDTMLAKCLALINVELPGGARKTMILVDFTDPGDPQVINARHGFHPIGSPEWTGGVILTLQKNAVRFWDKGLWEKARLYKAMAEYLSGEAMESKYTYHGMAMFPYATAQGVAVGHGWKTPYFYIKNPHGTGVKVSGGSLIGAWPLMPMNGFNPFILNDPYFDTYQKIPLQASDRQEAVNFVASLAANHTFTEPVVTKGIDSRSQIVEPSYFNHSAWLAYDNNKYKEAIFWAGKVVRDPVWFALAMKEEKLKMKKIGGIIDYPWGQMYKNNENPLHYEIWKYPLLNEVATAMWLLASSNYKLKRTTQAKYWIKRLVQDLPLHQIAHVVRGHNIGQADLIDGYWNALISWVYNPAMSKSDRDINELINTMGLQVQTPSTVDIDTTDYTRAFLHTPFKPTSAS